MSVLYLVSIKLQLYRPNITLIITAIKRAFKKSFANEQDAFKSSFAFFDILFVIPDPPFIFNR